VVIRRGASADAAPLAALAERTFRDTFAADNKSVDMDAYCATAYSPAIQGRQLADPDIDTLVVDLDGTLVGYAQLRPGAPTVIPGRGAIELWRFYVERTQHGRGVAAALMDATVAAARARGARTIWLGVWERNFRAQAFYRKVGFVDVGAQPFVLGTDVQMDRIMARALAQPA
jgi:ribosomal protein S18 acetylase RimI-like enzyme